MVGVVVGEFYITPRDVFDSAVYSAGFAAFILAGAYPLAVTKSSRVPRATVIAVVSTLATGVSISDVFPPLFMFAFGFPGLNQKLKPQQLLKDP